METISKQDYTKKLNLKTIFGLVFGLTISILSSSFTFGQTSNDNYIFWSSTRKLTVDDFGIKTKNGETNPSFAQFSVDYQVNGFDFMTKNFNKKVRNYLIKSASWIDTTTNISVSLRYQQTLFDICEIYTRQFRKSLNENRKKIANGLQIVEEMNQKAMTDFSNRRVLYDRETNFGTIQDKQIEWELQIQKELYDLKEFASE